MSTAARAESTGVVRRDQQSTVSKRDRNETFKAKIVEFAPTLMQVLPSYVKPERMITLALTAATKNPRLLECTMESVALAMMQIAQWDLEIGRTAYLVPFKNTCTAIPAWQGLTELMLRTGHVRDVKAKAVYANEHFRVREGDAPRLEHDPIFDANARGALTAFYAVAVLRGGERTWEVMTVDDVNKIRARSQSKDSDAWNNHYPEMGKKTAIRRLAKRMPMNVQSSQLRSALSTEDRLDAGELLDAIRMREAQLSSGDHGDRPKQMLVASSEIGGYDMSTSGLEQPSNPVSVPGSTPTTAHRATASAGAGMQDPYGQSSEAPEESAGGGGGGNRGETPSSSGPASVMTIPFSQGASAKGTPITDISEKDLSDAVKFAGDLPKYAEFVEAAIDELEARKARRDEEG